MNEIELKILNLNKNKNIFSMSLRALAKEVGIKNPATAKYYIKKLQKLGYMETTPKGIDFEEVITSYKNSYNAVINVPILGAANCGIATINADELFEGYLKISKKLLYTKKYQNIFAVKAIGDSMNKANIRGENIENGDYLIIDSSMPSTIQSGDYVLSIINGQANIKKIAINNDKFILNSESSFEYEPIYIHYDDIYLINGIVIQVIKT